MPNEHEKLPSGKLAEALDEYGSWPPSNREKYYPVIEEAARKFAALEPLLREIVTANTDLTRPKLCPVCGSKPTIGLGKKQGCQLHGEPMQSVYISCTTKNCFAQPNVCAGDIFNGGKQKATQEAIEKWNRRVDETMYGDITARIREVVDGKA